MYFFTKERAMYLSPDGMASIVAQRQQELIDDAQRWHLARTARRARRHGAARRATGSHDSGAAHHRADLDGCAAASAGASRRGLIAVGGAGRQGGAGTPTATERWARIDRFADEADRGGRAARWARLDRDEAALTREALFAGRTAALAAIAALSVQPSNLAPCGAPEAGQVR